MSYGNKILSYKAVNQRYFNIEFERASQWNRLFIWQAIIDIKLWLSCNEIKLILIIQPPSRPTFLPTNH